MIVEEFSVPVILRTSFIDEVVGSIHPAKTEIVPDHFPTVTTLMVHEANIVAEKDKSGSSQEMEEDPALLVALTVGIPKSNTVIRLVVLKAICDAPVLVFLKAVGLIDVVR